MHPVVLAVHHVVADLHVVEDLRHREGGRAGEPGRGQEAEDQAARGRRPRARAGRGSPGGCSRRRARRGRRRARARIASSSAPNASSCSSVRVGCGVWACSCLLSQWWSEVDGRWVQRSISTSPTGTETQIRMSSSSVAEVSPVSSVADGAGHHAAGAGVADAHPAAVRGVRPAASACSSSGRPLVLGLDGRWRAKRTVPSAASGSSATRRRARRARPWSRASAPSPAQRRADGVDQRRRAADERRRLGVVGDRGARGARGRSGPASVARRCALGEAARDQHAAVGCRRSVRELGVVERQLGRAGVVEEA